MGDVADVNDTSSTTTTVDINGTTAITGNFEANLHNLTVTRITRNADGSANANGNLGGSIAGDGALAHGTLTELMAIANPGYDFVEWSIVNNIDLDVSVANNAYFVKGQSRPTLILVRGNVYNFNLDSSTNDQHPFYFSTDSNGGGDYAGQFTSGVTDSNASGIVTISIDVNASTPDTLYYYSGSEEGVGNLITVVDASSIELGQFSSTSAGNHVNMAGDRAYQVIFQRKSYSVTYAPYPASNGSISFDTYDGSSSVEHGTTITATANPANGYRFVSWSGEGLTTSQQLQTDPLALIITEDRTITANFAKVGPITLTLLVSPEGAGSAVGSGSYDTIEDPSIFIFATANESYKFIGWQGGDSYVSNTTNPSTTVNPIDDLTLTAVFEFVPGAANEPKARPLEAVYSGWDWWLSDWFGYYWYISGRNWVFHRELGWCYMVVQSEDSAWIWADCFQNWVWTNPKLYPFMFDHQDGDWVWFNREESSTGAGNRIFYRYSIEDWEKR